MSLQQLFENLEDIIRTPGDVTQLKAAILGLAVQGRLVPQDGRDGSAHDLLKIVVDEKRKTDKRLPTDWVPASIDQDVMPFTIPSQWTWTRIGDIGIVNPRNQADDTLPVSFVPMNLISDGIGSGHSSETRLWKEVRQGFTHFAEGDVGLAKITPCFQNRKSTVFSGLQNGIGAGTTELHIFRPVANTVLSAYILLYFQTDLFLAGGIASMTGTAGQQRVSRTYFEEAPFPLPPLAEQHRIVAKEDELLAQTRALEANLRRAQEEIVVVNQAALHRLETAEDPESLHAAWHTISGAFDLLYDDPRPLTVLRQTILQLAVRGRLARQGAGDEPAVKLISRIQNEHDLQRTRVVALKTPVGPYSLPEGWAWATFDTVAKIATNGVDPSDFGEWPHVAPDNIEKGTGRLLAYRSIREDGVSSVKHRFYPGQILYSKIRPNLSKAVLVDFEGLCSADMYPITPHIERRYLHSYMLSSTFRSLTTVSDTRVAMPKINQDALSRVLVPVPPLAEQRRIVAKVDELLGMCDALERQLDRAAAAQKAAVASVLAHLSQQG
jgi:type I restriction enzyme S subunit